MEMFGYPEMGNLDCIFLTLGLVFGGFLFTQFVLGASWAGSPMIKNYINRQGTRCVWFPLHPNNLSYFRIFMVAVSLALLFFAKLKISAVIFILAAFTDYLDGKIARKCGLTTSLGKKLDPLADKILAIPFLFYFAFTGVIPEFWTYAMILVDLAGQFLIRPILVYYGKTVQANWWGKIKTVLIISLILSCFSLKICSVVPGLVILILFWLSFAFTLISFFTKFSRIRR